MWESVGIAPCILNLGTQEGGEWPASSHGRFKPGESNNKLTVASNPKIF